MSAANNLQVGARPKKKEEKDSFLGLLLELQKRATQLPYCPGSGCQCLCCQRHAVHSPVPISTENPLLTQSHLTNFLTLASQCVPCAPNFPILDTVLFQKGYPVVQVYFNQSIKVNHEVVKDALKDQLLKKKLIADLQYLKREHKRKNPGFFFNALDFKSEQQTKLFEKQIKNIHPSQRKVCTVKLRQRPKELVLVQSQFEELMRPNSSHKMYSLEDVEYIQLFPIPFDEEEKCRLRKITFKRDIHSKTEMYRVAEHNYCIWTQRNGTLEEQEKRFLAENVRTVQELLLYSVFKLVVHLEYARNIRVNTGLFEFFTDNHQQTWLKNVQGFSYTDKIVPQEKDKDTEKEKGKQQFLLRLKKVVALRQMPHPAIDLSQAMDKEFMDFQNRYKEVFATQLEDMTEEIMDSAESDHTFRTITKQKDANFEKALLSTDVSIKIKKRVLQLG